MYSTLYIILALITGIVCGDLALHQVGLICLVMLPCRPSMGIIFLYLGYVSFMLVSINISASNQYMPLKLLA